MTKYLSALTLKASFRASDRGAISVCESRLNEDTTLKTRSWTDLCVQTIIQLLRFCLTSITFQYDGKHYQEKDGLAMGSPVSPVIAYLFMIDLENKTFRSCTIVNVSLPRKCMVQVCGWRHFHHQKDRLGTLLGTPELAEWKDQFYHGKWKGRLFTLHGRSFHEADGWKSTKLLKSTKLSKCCKCR